MQEALEKVGKNNIKISDRIKNKIERNTGLSINTILDKLYDFKSYVFAAKYISGDYRIITELSSKYHLVIVIFINYEIRMATAFKSSKDLEKLLKKSQIIYNITKKIPEESSINV